MFLRALEPCLTRVPHRLHALVYAALYTLAARVDAVAMLAMVYAVAASSACRWCCC